jgi:hypothetical protein
LRWNCKREVFYQEEEEEEEEEDVWNRENQKLQICHFTTV